jgi:hypothetical protein
MEFTLIELLAVISVIAIGRVKVSIGREGTSDIRQGRRPWCRDEKRIPA